jgi:hypothetical protein
MDAKNKRAREIQEAIHAILLNDWDPIGVQDEPLARTEYSSCVGPVYHALAAGTSEEEIASTLERIEVEDLGTTSSGDRRAAAARKLRALDIRLN